MNAKMHFREMTFKLFYQIGNKFQCVNTKMIFHEMTFKKNLPYKFKFFCNLKFQEK